MESRSVQGREEIGGGEVDEFESAIVLLYDVCDAAVVVLQIASPSAILCWPTCQVTSDVYC